MSSDERPKKRSKRYLLTAAALSAGTMLAGCGSQQSDTDPVAMPGNPKGSVYDEGTQQVADEPPPPPPEEEEPEPVRPIPLPANPKGAVYEDGLYGDDEPRRG